MPLNLFLFLFLCVFPDKNYFLNPFSFIFFKVDVLKSSIVCLFSYKSISKEGVWLLHFWFCSFSFYRETRPMFFVILSKYRCFFSTVRQIQINKDNFHFIMIIYICLIFLWVAFIFGIFSFECVILFISHFKFLSLMPFWWNLTVQN